MNKHLINIKDTGAIGDGITDDSESIQKALDAGCQTVVIPGGNYRIATTLKVHSDTFLSADNDAHLFVCGESPHHRGDFLLTNADPITGNLNITIKGGIWDGGFGGKYNVKNKDLFDPNANSGACLNFVGVKNLILTDMVIANSVTYYMRFSRIENFVIKNIGFRSEQLSYNQDGLHFGGEVRNGYVENIRALSDGQTNDDMIALNADDSIERLENRDLARGDIENIYIKD
ncbi:MAG: glycosyl hydrolase family 28-related protein, partial [Clostridia bacterium]